MTITEGQRTSHGPNECYGPPCCRGLAQRCIDEDDPEGEGCLDFCCCCDPCLHDFIAPDDVGGVIEAGDLSCPNCCKCVPKGIVARFTPDVDDGGQCRELANMMWPTYGDPNMDATYTTSFPGAGGITIYLGKPDGPNGPCVWRLEAPALDDYSEEFEVNHRGIKCTRLPSFTPLEVTYGIFCSETCSGTITFEQYTPEKLPFRQIDLSEQDETVPVECGGCTEACWALCVRRRAAEGGSDAEEIERHTFTWNEDDQVWRGGKAVGAGDCGTEEFKLTDIDGHCFLEIVQFDIVTFVGDLIAMNACSHGLYVEAEDEDGNWISISCNRCNCWNYLCGRCRCACPQLCMVGEDAGNTPVGPLSLTWDETAEGWVDEFDVVRASIVPDPDNCTSSPPCRVQFEDFEELAEINEICGNNISAGSIDGNVAPYTNFRWRHVWCSLGAPCTGGGCDTCDSVPPVIYCSVTSDLIDPIDNCVSAKCIVDFTFPLYLVRNPPGAAAAFQWIGYHVFPCEICTFPGGTEQVRIQIVVGCDGSVFLNGSTPLGSIRIPCLECDDPLDETISWLAGISPLGCCSESTSNLQFTFTE